MDGEKLVGAVVVGRPVARMTDQYTVAEVTRLVTDGTKNACSFLYAAAARAAREMGFEKIQTFILDEEPGTSILAAGWEAEAVSGGGDWNSPSRGGRRTDQPMGPKRKYSKRLNTHHQPQRSGMSKPRVYLAGPIAGLTYEGATDWRERAARMLAPEIIALSPMRGKEHLRGTGAINPQPDVAQRARAVSTPKGIVARDRNDTMTSDAVLMYLKGAEKVSIGTMIEIGWADAARRPLIIVKEPENVHTHVMVDEIASYLVPTLEEAVAIIKTLLYRGLPLPEAKALRARAEIFAAMGEE